MDFDLSVLTVSEIAEALKIKTDTVRRLFANEPGVVVLSSPPSRRRPYRSLRIPVTVLIRVLRRFSGDHFRWPDDLQHPLSTVDEIAVALRVSPDTVRRRFELMPGVITLCSPRRSTRRYRTMRIPARVRLLVLRSPELIDDPLRDDRFQQCPQDPPAMQPSDSRTRSQDRP